MMFSRHLISRGLFAATAWVVLAAGAQASDWRGVDGKAVTIDPPSGVSLVVYTNGDLASETRELTSAVNALHPPKNFQIVRIIDLRGDVTPAVRPTVTKRIKSEGRCR